MRASKAKGDKYEEGYTSGYKDASMDIVEQIDDIIDNCQCSSDYFDALDSWKKELREGGEK